MARPPVVPRDFRFLVKGEDRDPQDVLECSMSPELARTGMLVRNEQSGHYLWFPSVDDFWVFSDNTDPPSRCFHEVVFGDMRQRLKFDIDANVDGAGGVDMITPQALGISDRPGLFGRERKARAIIGAIIDAVDHVFNGTFLECGHAIGRDDIIVCTSHGPTKYSYHLIVSGFLVLDNHEARGFTREVIDFLPAAVAKFVDAGVNMSKQNFRVLESTKKVRGGANANPRFKVFEPGLGAGRLKNRDLTLIAHGDSVRWMTVLPSRWAQNSRRAGGCVFRPVDDTFDKIGRTIAETCERAGLTHGFKFRAVKNCFVMFDRLFPTACRICKKTHMKDNTLMFTLTATEPRRIVEWCRRSEGGKKTILHDLIVPGLEPVVEELAWMSDDDRAMIADLVEPAAERAAERAAGAPLEFDEQVVAEQYLRPVRAQPLRVARGATLAQHIEQIISGAHDPHSSQASAFENAPGLVYDAPLMRKYEDVPTLVVKAQMGLGKTQELRRHIAERYPQNALVAPVIRFVTFRRTFSRSIKDTFQDFELYQDHVGPLGTQQFPRLIVQVESIHRLTMTTPAEPIDLLVLDEVESILSQFNSGLHKNFNANWAMFEWMLRTARKVVCMDANVGDRTFRTLERIRCGANRGAFFHWNQHLRDTGDLAPKFRFTTDRGIWGGRLVADVRAGKRVVVATNCLSEAETIGDMLKTMFPTKMVRIYSSRTEEAEKNTHFADVDVYWSQLDVLIYTPTVSAGISYEREHYDVMYGNFSDKSCDVETCRQMLGRIRNIADREFVIFLDGQRRQLPTTPEEVQKYVVDRRSHLLQEAGDRVQFAYDDDGNVKLFRTPYFDVWVSTECVSNLSKSDFIRRFVDQVADAGGSVQVLDPLSVTDEVRKAARAAVRDSRTAVKVRSSEALANASELTPEEATDLHRKIANDNATVTLGDRLALRKFNIRTTFGIHDVGIPAEFAGILDDRRVADASRNLRLVGAHASMNEAVQAICDQERAAARITRERVVTMGIPLATSEHDDLTKRYQYTRHNDTLRLLQACGFLCLTDPDSLPETYVAACLRRDARWIAQNASTFAYEHQVAISSQWCQIHIAANDRMYAWKLIQGVVNPVMRKMYGLALSRAGDKYRVGRAGPGQHIRLGDRGGFSVADLTVTVACRLVVAEVARTSRLLDILAAEAGIDVVEPPGPGPGDE